MQRPQPLPERGWGDTCPSWGWREGPAAPPEPPAGQTCLARGHPRSHCPLRAAELQLHPPRCAFWVWGMLDVLWGQGVMAQSCPCTWQLTAAGIFVPSICDFLPTQCPSSDARNDKLLQTRSNSDPSRLLPQSLTAEEAPHHPAPQESTVPHPAHFQDKFCCPG